ncbi:putative lipoprotein transmembrane [Candidatus Burkholderia pumila]|uniref:Lipoprotein transmembrane n=1 Tax=Candidatus Burkholderia pumila TaxID=1090375 RepID=A0ABR5HPH2_9BURK|nr:putative lipoprotein transmembrane [Candidatus Burkholderia pumila]
MNLSIDAPARWRILARIALALGVLWLVGCTTYVQTQVTAFSNWNANSTDATRTYVFQRNGKQGNSIEQQTYEVLVASELQKYNFRQVPDNSAHYQVSLNYSVRGDTMTVRQPVFYDPWPMYGPYGRPFWGPWGGGWGYGPWGPAGYVDQSYPVYTHALQIRMTDRTTGREVYKVTAVNSTDDSSLYGSMPYLAQSALAGFPLGNGTVRTVTLKVDKNGLPSNETASTMNGNERPVAPAPTLSGSAPKAE